jgi:hypothetical protein
VSQFRSQSRHARLRLAARRRGVRLRAERGDAPPARQIIPAAEDRRVVRNWARGVAIVYGALALIVLGLASLSHYFANGSKGPAATAVTSVAADKNQRQR